MSKKETVRIRRPYILKPSHLYREHNHLASTLRESLDELMAAKKMTPQLAEKIWIHYDVRITNGLTRSTPRMQFSASIQDHHMDEGKNYVFRLKDAQLSVKSPFGLKQDWVHNMSIPKVELRMFPTPFAHRRMTAPPKSVYHKQNQGKAADGNANAKKKRISRM